MVTGTAVLAISIAAVFSNLERPLTQISGSRQY